MIGPVDWASIGPLIRMALEEDLGGDGDVTTAAVFDQEERRCVLVSKDTGVLAGSTVFEQVLRSLDPAARAVFRVSDGAILAVGDVVADVEGKAAAILRAERTALNFLSFLSGIATKTRAFVQASRGAVQILDTRKTLPGFRALSKYAVRVGGGQNHRAGLYDMVLIKDNHIDLCGSITGAVERVRRRWGHRFRVEVECRTVPEVEEAMEAGANVIMLDNMSPKEMTRAIALRRGEVRFEISGNVTLDRVPELAALGADYISVGELTSSVRRFDFSLRAAGAP